MATFVTTHRFDDVYQAFRPRIVRFLQRLVGDADAEDLAQEVFLRVSRSLPEFRGESALPTWIYRIATNAALDRLRQRRARPEMAGVADLAFFESTGAALDALAARREMSDCIRSYIYRLPPSYRDVLALSDLEGMGAREIGDVLGISVGAVKTRLHRARTRLKREMELGCALYRDERNELACEPMRPPSPAAGPPSA